MKYYKGKCLEELDKIVERKDCDNDHDKYLSSILGEDELYLKFNFKSIAQSSLYVYKLLQQCNEFEAETHRYICEINNLSWVYGEVKVK